MAPPTPRLTGAAAALSLSLLLAACVASGPDGTGTGALVGTGSSVTGATQMLVMQAARTAAQPGETVAYTVMARNTTALDLRDVEVGVTFPLQKVAIMDAGGGAADDNRIQWNIPLLKAGEAVTLPYRVTLLASLAQGDIVRTVVSMRATNLQTPATGQFELRVGAGGQDIPLPSVSSVAAAVSSSSVNPGYSFFLGENGSSSSSVPSSAPSAVQPGEASVAITQQADQTERQPGTRLRYTVTVRNTGAEPLTGASVSVLLPQNLLLTNTGGGNLRQGTGITWDLPSLAPGASRTFTYRGSVREEAAEGDTVTTIAQVSAPALPAPRVATTSVRVLGRLPQAGTDGSFFRPSERRFLKPVKE